MRAVESENFEYIIRGSSCEEGAEYQASDIWVVESPFSDHHGSDCYRTFGGFETLAESLRFMLLATANTWRAPCEMLIHEHLDLVGQFFLDGGENRYHVPSAHYEDLYSNRLPICDGPDVSMLAPGLGPFVDDPFVTDDKVIYDVFRDAVGEGDFQFSIERQYITRAIPLNVPYILHCHRQMEPHGEVFSSFAGAMGRWASLVKHGEDKFIRIRIFLTPHGCFVQHFTECSIDPTYASVRDLFISPLRIRPQFNHHPGLDFLHKNDDWLGHVGLMVKSALENDMRSGDCDGRAMLKLFEKFGLHVDRNIQSEYSGSGAYYY